MNTHERLRKKIGLLLAFLSLALTAKSQPYTLLPGRGIQEIDLVIDTSSLEDVFDLFGMSYRIIQQRYVTTYAYDSLGLEFSVDPYDLNKILREIGVKAPAHASLENGIELGHSTMKDVFEEYGETGCFVLDEYACQPQEGVTFYIPLKNRKRGNFDPKTLVTLVEISRLGKNGQPSKANYQFDPRPIEKFRKEIITRLANKEIDNRTLIVYIDSLSQKKNVPYEVSWAEYSRKLPYGLREYRLTFQMWPAEFKLTCIYLGNVFLSCRFWQKDSLHYEEFNTEALDIFYGKQNPRVGDITQIYEPVVFGSFCGIVPGPPEYCQRMANLVNADSLEALKDWLYSPNVEIAVYGAVGLTYLELSGQNVIDEEAGKAIASLKTLYTELNYCRGCQYGIRKPPHELLNDKYIKQFFKMANSPGW